MCPCAPVLLINARHPWSAALFSLLNAYVQYFTSFSCNIMHACCHTFWRGWLCRVSQTVSVRACEHVTRLHNVSVVSAGRRVL
jgi:hypothetical protein